MLIPKIYKLIPSNFHLLILLFLIPKNLSSFTTTLQRYINPEKPYVPLNKNDAFQKVQKRRVQKKR